MRILLALLALLTALLAQPTEHPTQLSYHTFDWQIPLGEQYRTVLDDSVVAYIVTDTSLPVFDLTITLSRGDLQAPADKPALSVLYLSTLKEGGSKHYTPSEFEETLELYALSLSISSTSTTTSFTLSGLSQYYDTATTLLIDLIKNPTFNEERFIDNKKYYKESILHRCDTPAPIRSAAWSKVMYPHSYFSKLLTADDLDALTRKDLKAYHKQLINKAPLSVAAAGDISTQQVKDFLKGAFKSKKRSELPFDSVAIAPSHTTVVVHKKGVNQAYISTGFPSFKRPDPRYYPLTIYNQVLGGGGFNSRLVSQVRSDAGLTYSIRSNVASNYLFDPSFSVSLFTKSATVNHAIGLTQKIIKETAQENISDQ